MHRVLPAQAPRESRQIRRTQTVFDGAVHDVHPVRIGQRQLIGELAGAVRAAVVDDQDVHPRRGLVHPADE